MRSALKWTAGALGVAAGAYAGYVGVTWLRYGHPAPARADDADPLLDRFMPTYEIVERHHIGVAAPGAVTLDVAREVELQASPVVRAVIRAREILLGATPDTRRHSGGLLAETQSLGWGVLAEVPERQIVVGAVTKPWEANVTFRALPPDQFAAFNEPGYVKIAWTIRADAISETESVFRTETRAIATDPDARTRFRRYWSFLSPGIIVIRWALLDPVRSEAERRAQETGYELQPALHHQPR
jgi:hypothetical protein